MRRAFFAVVAVLSLSLYADTRTWTGAVDNKWNNAGNWDALPVAGDDLVFTGGSNRNTINDFPSDTAFRTIETGGGVGPSFSFGGSRIVLTNGLLAYDATFDLPITVGGNQRWSASCCATTTYTNTIDLNGYRLELFSYFAPGGNRGRHDFSGPIVGSGSIAGYIGWVTFRANNTFAGPLSADREFTVLHAHALGVSDGTTANGTSGTVVINGVSIGNEAFSLGDVQAIGTVSIDGPMLGAAGRNGGSISVASSGNLTLNGPISGGVVTLNGGSNATMTLLNTANTAEGLNLDGATSFRLIVGVNGALSSSGDLFVNNGALDMNNRSASVRTLQMNNGRIRAGDKPLVAANSVQLSGWLTLTDAFDGVTGQSYTIIRNDGSGAVNGQFNDLPEGGSFTLRGQTYVITYVGGNGNDVVLDAGAPPLISTSTSLGSSQNPADEGSTVTFTATVSASSGTPAGMVTFRDNGSPIHTATLSGGQATFSTSTLSPGTHPITATYGGSSTHAQSGSTTVSQVINDVPSQLSVANTSASEGNDNALFDVTLSPASSTTITVDYATFNRSATAGSDYRSKSGTLTFLPGEKKKRIEVDLMNDATSEGEESFGVRLSNATGDATIQRSEAVATIFDDDQTFVTTTHEYAHIGERSLVLDLTVPDGAGPFPVIVWIHGGGWKSGVRTPNPALREVARGYAVAAVDYRLSTEARFPAQIADVKAAIRWLRANAAQHELDANRIGAWGIEAGAHLASLLGTAMYAFDDVAHGNAQFSSRVLAVVEWGGATNLMSMNATSLPCSTIDHNAPTSDAAQLLGCAVPDCPDHAIEASPVTWASPNDAAFDIVHGEDDCSVPPAQALELYNALHDVNGDATLFLVDGVGGLSDSYWSSEGVLSRADAFFDARLKNAPLPGRRRASR